MVEVFKTNVQCPVEAERLVGRLLEQLPLCSINFDLEDCDRILRIEGHPIHNPHVIALLDSHGYNCEVLA